MYERAEAMAEAGAARVSLGLGSPVMLSSPPSAARAAKRARVFVCVLIAAHALLTATFAFARYGSVHNRTFDLALYARMAWGLVHGQAWDPIVGGQFLGGHVALVLAPLGLLGMVFGTVPVLLGTQSAAIALSAWPLYRFAERRLAPPMAALVAIAWLLQPNLPQVATYEFHPGTLALLPMCAAFDALDRRHARAFAWSCGAIVACRASLALQTLLLCVLAFRDPQLRRVGERGAVASLAYFVLWVAWLQPSFGAALNSSADLHYAQWGGSPLGIAPVLLRDPARVLAHFGAAERLVYPWLVLSTFAFLPLLRPRMLLVALPPIALNLASAFPTASTLYSHYLTPALPACAFAATIALAALVERIQPMRWFAPAALLFASAVGSVCAGGLPWSRDYARADFHADAATMQRRAVLALIGARSSVQAPDALLPHLAERNLVFRAPPPDRGARLVVLDITHRRRFARREDLLRTLEEPGVRNWLARDDYGAVFANQQLLVLRRGASTRAALGRGYIAGRAALGAGTPLCDCLAVRGAALDGWRVWLDLVARARCPADLAIRIGAEELPARVDLLFDGILSPAQLGSGDALRSPHVLSAQERAAIVQRGLYVGALRASGARPQPSDPPSVLVPLQLVR
jgi:uncharacterized membrane protein